MRGRVDPKHVQSAQGVPQTAEARAALLASIVEHSDDAIVAGSLDGTITSWNHGAELIYGYPAEEILGRPTSTMTRSDRPNPTDGILERIRGGARAAHYETMRVRKDGVVISVSLTISPILDPDGTLVGFSSIGRDVTEQKQALQYARSLIDASRDPLVIISPEGKITDVNEATIKVTGADREVLVGADFFDYFTEPEKAREGYKEVFEKGTVSDYPLTIRHKDGPLTDVLFNASVYKDVRGNVLGVSAVARDVTEQKRAEAEVAELRAKEIERLAELERFQKLTVGRELKMIELKKEIAELTQITSTGIDDG